MKVGDKATSTAGVQPADGSSSLDVSTEVWQDLLILGVIFLVRLFLEMLV